MRKAILAGAFAVAIAASVGAFASTATAFPSRATSCASCHSGPTVVVTATQTSNNGTTASYAVSAPGASYISVFDGASKISQLTGSSGTISVAVGKTFVIQGVAGPSDTTGWGSTSISPVAPPVGDTVAPTTTSDAVATYIGSAAIALTASDNAGGSGVAHTYYVLDGAAQASGTAIGTSVVGSHTLSFWSVDVAGNIEAHKSVDFSVTAPVVDIIAPTTVSNVKATYAGPATIALTAIDELGGSGVAHTYYVLDGGGQVEGLTLTVSSVGTHTVEFWSVDVAGNAEMHDAAVFQITAVAKKCTLASNVSSVRRNHRVRLYGTIAPAVVGNRASIYVKKPGSSRWVLLTKRATTSTSGVSGAKWSYYYTPKSHGTYRFQVRFSGIVSRTVKVVVR